MQAMELHERTSKPLTRKGPDVKLLETICVGSVNNNKTWVDASDGTT